MEELKLVSWDTETHLIPPIGTGRVNTAFPCPDVVCTTYARWDGDEGLISWEDEEGVQALFRIPGATYVAHNVQFDLSVLSKAYPKLYPRLRELVSAGRILDTRVMYLLRDPDPPTKKVSLAALNKFFDGGDMNKGAVRTSFTRAGRMTSEQREYAIEDARVTLRIAQRMLEMPLGSIASHHHKSWIFEAHPQHHIATKIVPGETPDVRFSKAACHTAWNLVPNGLRVDPVKLREHNQRLFDTVVELRTRLIEEGFAVMKRAPKSEIRDIRHDDRCNMTMEESKLERSWAPYTSEPPEVIRVWKGVIQVTDAVITVKQGELRVLAERWCAENEIDNMPCSPKTHAISLKRDDWADYIGKLPAPLELFMQYQRAAKHWGAFTRPLVEAAVERVYANYWIPGAATGRWACSRVNLQQVPKKLREIYIPSDGTIFVSADYPTLELYTLAQVMHGMGIEGPLLEALKRHASGEMDIHTWTAEQMGRSRQEAKIANFSLAGGMGVRRFAKDNGYTFSEGRAIREKWFEVFWDIRRYLNFFNVNAYGLCPIGDKKEWLRRLGFDPDQTWPGSFELTRAINDGRIFTVTLPDGRVIPERGYSAAANCFFQGLGASVMTEAFNRICESNLRVVSVVHDSIMVEAPDDGSNDIGIAGNIIIRHMQGALSALCPDVPIPIIEYEVHERWQ